MSPGERWFGTFESVFMSRDRTLIITVLDTICKTEKENGMFKAAGIACSYEMENEDIDNIVRGVAREIESAALDLSR